MAATVEILIFQNQRESQKRILTDICDAVRGTITNSYQGHCEWLVVFGWGGHRQQDAFRRHRASGKPVLVLDYGFFGKDKTRYRIAVNGFFPTHHLHHAGDGSRFDRLGIQLESLGDKEGRVVLLELTRKSCDAFGYGLGEWENRQLKNIRHAFGERDVVIRPKRMQRSAWKIPVVADGNIRDAINGAALVVVHHSNVAVDCAILGVDCVACRGIGEGFYPAEVGIDAHRTHDERLRFLQQVAWFDWGLGEAAEMMDFARHINTVSV